MEKEIKEMTTIIHECQCQSNLQMDVVGSIKMIGLVLLIKNI